MCVAPGGNCCLQQQGNNNNTAPAPAPAAQQRARTVAVAVIVAVSLRTREMLCMLAFIMYLFNCSRWIQSALDALRLLTMAAVVAAAAAPVMASAASSAACCLVGSCASKLCCGDRCCGINSANILYFVMWLASAFAAFLLYVRQLLLAMPPVLRFQTPSPPSGTSSPQLQTARLEPRFLRCLVLTMIRAAKRPPTFCA